MMELVADMLNVTTNMMNFISDELLFQKSQKLANLKQTKTSIERDMASVDNMAQALIANTTELRRQMGLLMAPKDQ